MPISASETVFAILFVVLGMLFLISLVAAMVINFRMVQRDQDEGLQMLPGRSCGVTEHAAASDVAAGAWGEAIRRRSRSPFVNLWWTAHSSAAQPLHAIAQSAALSLGLRLRGRQFDYGFVSVSLQSHGSEPWVKCRPRLDHCSGAAFVQASDRLCS